MFQRAALVLFMMNLASGNGSAQGVQVALASALHKLSADAQFKHATLSLYVTDAQTGKPVYDMNSEVGLAPASCQKIVTSVSAFELLGGDYRYKTYIAASEQVSNGLLKGDLFISGGGDPTLGSDRWKSTAGPVILEKILGVLKRNKILTITGDLVGDDSHFSNEAVPGGWVWEDIGNYYGAGTWGINWNENKFDCTFKTGKTPGTSTDIVSTRPASILQNYNFTNFVTTAAKETGDNAYLFSSPFQKNITARGTIPVSENGFSISGSIPDPPGTFLMTARDYLRDNGINLPSGAYSFSDRRLYNKTVPGPVYRLDSILSPPLDSINYWLLKKSVNLFGEAFIKTIGYESSNQGSTDSGIAVIRQFWNKNGIESSALNMIDGSGLSPANRLTTHSLVTILQYAKQRTWFSSFYNALPEINGIKMKDGYISGVRSYAGYIRTKNGAEYIFAFIVNNISGDAGSAREKMWSVLDIIK